MAKLFKMIVTEIDTETNEEKARHRTQKQTFCGRLWRDKR